MGATVGLASSSEVDTTCVAPGCVDADSTIVLGLDCDWKIVLSAVVHDKPEQLVYVWTELPTAVGVAAGLETSSDVDTSCVVAACDGAGSVIVVASVVQ